MAGKKGQKKRFWADDKKRSIWAQTLAPGVSVAQVARRCSINANLIFNWVKDPRFSPAASETAGPPGRRRRLCAGGGFRLHHRPADRRHDDGDNRTPLARLAPITIAKDVLRLLPRGTHDPAMFIKPAEVRASLQRVGLVPGATSGLGPRGINRRLDMTLGPLPLTAILYMAIAQKSATGGHA